MPLPKQRQSKSRTRKRRTHQKLFAAALVPCGHCNTPKRAHTVCPNCGYYRGRHVVETKEK